MTELSGPGSHLLTESFGRNSRAPGPDSDSAGRAAGHAGRLWELFLSPCEKLPAYPSWAGGISEFGKAHRN